MTRTEAIAALAALARETRLAILMLLVQRVGEACLQAN
jgi:DNA-binding transcriptional ArsR family regulator